MDMKYTAKIEKALQTAAILHRDQLRKNTVAIPYITHPFAVALILSNYTDEEDVLVAGLLHDTVEDSEYTADDLGKDFGANVREIVAGVTEVKDDEKGNKRPWKIRKEDYIANLKNDSQGSLLLCAADKIHNMRTMLDEFNLSGPEFLGNFNCTPEEKHWYHSEILKVLEDKLENKEILVDYRRILEESGKMKG